MSLNKKQNLLIRLCLDNQFFSFVKKNMLRRVKLVGDRKGLNPFLREIKVSEVEHQLKAINRLLLLDFQNNLLDLHSKIENFEEIYFEYRNIFPFREEPKHVEYLRFLNFVLTRVSSENKNLKDLIVHEINILLSTVLLFRNRDVVIEKSKTKKPVYYLNPTLVLSKTMNGEDKNLKGYFYTKGDNDISIADLESDVYLSLKRLITQAQEDLVPVTINSEDISVLFCGKASEEEALASGILI